MTPTKKDQDGELTTRQRAVLDAVLELMVREGDQLTMTPVARRASCSKETLYKWFGDRDGLLDRDGAMAGLAGSAPEATTASVSMPHRCARASRTSPRPGSTVISSQHLDRAEPRRHRPCRLAQEQSRRHRAGERTLRHRRAAEAGARSRARGGAARLRRRRDGVPHLLRPRRPRRADQAAARRQARADGRRHRSATPPAPPTSSSHFTGGLIRAAKPEETTQPKEGPNTCAFITIVMPTST